MVDWQEAERVIDLIALKWVLPVLRELTQGPKGHNELMRELNVEHKPLIRTLRRLEAAQLVAREIQPTPLRVHYHLTPQSDSLLEALEVLSAAGREFPVAD